MCMNFLWIAKCGIVPLLQWMLCLFCNEKYCCKFKKKLIVGILYVCFTILKLISSTNALLEKLAKFVVRCSVLFIH